MSVFCRKHIKDVIEMAGLVMLSFFSILVAMLIVVCLATLMTGLLIVKTEKLFPDKKWLEL